MSIKTRRITFTGIMIALAYVSLFFIRIPIIPSASFLRLDLKDVFVLIPGLLFGPIYAFVGAICVSFLQMLYVSEYGVIGLVMNILSVSAYTLPVSIVYKMRHNKKGLCVGLVIGCVCMTGTMLFWNYLITPLYMGVSREVVSTMIVPAFLPFNLIKSGIDSIVVFLFFTMINKQNVFSSLFEE